MGSSFAASAAPTEAFGKVCGGLSRLAPLPQRCSGDVCGGSSRLPPLPQMWGASIKRGLSSIRDPRSRRVAPARPICIHQALCQRSPMTASACRPGRALHQATAMHRAAICSFSSSSPAPPQPRPRLSCGSWPAARSWPSWPFRSTRTGGRSRRSWS